MAWLDLTIPEDDLLQPLPPGACKVSLLREPTAQAALAFYLRQLPAALAAINLQHGLTSNRAEQIKTLETDDGRTELRAVTEPDYG